MSQIESVAVEIRDISKESLSFEMHKEDDFGAVLIRYMSEQKLTVTNLSDRTGISKNTIIDYRTGNHVPKDIHKLVALCIGLQINECRAEYLISLAHMSLGYDIQGNAYRLLISLAFFSGMTIDQGNIILSSLDLPKL